MRLVGVVVGLLMVLGTAKVEASRNPCQPQAAVKKPSKKQILYTILKQRLMRVEANGSQSTFVMKLPKGTRGFVAGPKGHLLYTSYKRKIWEIDPWKKTWKARFDFGSFASDTCDTLELFGYRLLCSGEDGGIPLQVEWKLAESQNKNGATRQSFRRKIDEGRLLIVKDGVSLRVLGGRGGRAQVHLSCGKQKKIWGSSFYVPKDTQDIGLELSPNGRIVFVGLIRDFSAAGSFGRVYAIPFHGKKELVNKDNELSMAPAHWSFDGHWAVLKNRITNFEGVSFSIPTYQWITWATRP